MPSFDIWEIVKVPFPYTNRPVREWRPALVVRGGSIQDQHGLLWVMMITSVKNQGWSGDISVSDLSQAGLPVASVVRTAKIATIEGREAVRIGILPLANRGAVREQVSEILSMEECRFHSIATSSSGASDR